MKIIYLILIVSLFGCRTFDRIEVPGQPDSCNDMYTTMVYSLKLKEFFKADQNVSTVLTLVTTWTVKCQEDRAKLKIELQEKQRRDECIKLIYGPELLPKEENYQKYSEFLECLK